MDPEKYWTAGTHADLRLPGIPSHYKIAMQFLMSKFDFINSGGYDCSFEYQDAAVHDLMFRLQHNGFKVITAKQHCLIADWMPR